MIRKCEVAVCELLPREAIMIIIDLQNIKAVSRRVSSFQMKPPNPLLLFCAKIFMGNALGYTDFRVKRVDV